MQATTDFDFPPQKQIALLLKSVDFQHRISIIWGLQFNQFSDKNH